MEKIDYSLSAKFWNGKEHLKTEIETASMNAMSDVLVLTIEGGGALGLTDEQIGEERALKIAFLRELEVRLEAAATAASSYQRPSDLTADAPGIEQLEEFQALAQLLGSPRPGGSSGERG